MSDSHQSMSAGSVEVELKAIRQQIVNYIDAGAEGTHTVTITNGDLCKWFDRLEVVSAQLRDLAQPPLSQLAELPDYLDYLEQSLVDLDIDLKLPENMQSPSVWADRVRSALAAQPPAAPVEPDWSAVAEQAKAASDKVLQDAKVDPSQLQAVYRSSAATERPQVSIVPMALSDGRTDYYVQIKVGDRAVTPHVFREEYKSAYHVALYDWLLNGNGEEPDCVEFGPNDWPGRVMPDVPQTAPDREKVARAIHDGLGGDEWNDKRADLLNAADAVLALMPSQPQEARAAEIVGPFNADMPSSLNDACRRLDLAQERIAQLEALVEPKAPVIRCPCGLREMGSCPSCRKPPQQSQQVKAPDGYTKLPAGLICKCFKMWRDGNGEHWCCTPPLSRPHGERE